ncbi:unnamed protein product [Protopolystoma xenopodis]|uniref:Uncharacterized protein n=1 Tax=Protopolystoma xenopodis TaxID=117903 RepID=A0A3S5A8K4_9PLAT|nr:unnamed protein product [Protopolystoma xenopodis]
MPACTRGSGVTRLYCDLVTRLADSRFSLRVRSATNTFRSTDLSRPLQFREGWIVVQADLFEFVQPPDSVSDSILHSHFCYQSDGSSPLSPCFLRTLSHRLGANGEYRCFTELTAKATCAASCSAGQLRAGPRSDSAGMALCKKTIWVCGCQFRPISASSASPGRRLLRYKSGAKLRLIRGMTSFPSVVYLPGPKYLLMTNVIVQSDDDNAQTCMSIHLARRPSLFISAKVFPSQQ